LSQDDLAAVRKVPRNFKEIAATQISWNLPGTFRTLVAATPILSPMKDGKETHHIPELPAWKAFVVQFNRGTQSEAATFGGRVEHLSSGRRARFESADDLIAALGRLLAEVAREESSRRDE
jgi:hypothetical protein